MYSKKLMCVFVVLLVCSLSPAVAVEMSEVAKEAEKYDKDSKKEMGFFAKVNFISRGFQLVEKAEKAQKEADKVKGKKRSDKTEYELAMEKADEGIGIQKKLLDFRDSKKETNKNSTNSTNGTNVVVGDVDYVIPHECEDHINLLLQVLGEQGLNITFNHQTEVTTNLENHIVQLIDRSGFLRYVIVKKVDLNTEKPTVTVATDKGEKTLTLKDFKEAYTGLVLDTGDVPVDSVLGEILGFQRGELSEEHAKMCMLDDKTKSKMVTNGLMITLGMALITIGMVIYWFFSTFIIPRYFKKYAPPFEDIRPENVHVVDKELFRKTLLDIIRNPENRFRGISRFSWHRMLFHDFFDDTFSPNPRGAGADNLAYYFVRWIFQSEGKAMMDAHLEGTGVEYTLRTFTSVGVDTAMGNYVRTVVGIISIILVLTGTVMAYYNIHGLIDHTVELLYIKWFLTPLNTYKSELMDQWLDKESKTLPKPVNPVKTAKPLKPVKPVKTLKPLKPLGVVSVNNTPVSVG